MSEASPAERVLLAVVSDLSSVQVMTVGPLRPVLS